MDNIIKTIILVAVTFTVSDSASTPMPITCDSEPCGENQYCIMSGSTPICMVCSPWIFEGKTTDGKVRSPIMDELHEGVQPPEEKYFEFQRLNHFDGNNYKIWKQRYFTNNATYRSGGPIFLMLGGESEVNPAWLVNGAWQHYAHAYGAYLILLEHRYYGKSRPTEDLNVTNLQYLSSRQALADTAKFIKYFQDFNYNFQNNSIVVFGGSYAGSLAVWMRSKHPYLVDGVVASSPPLVAIADFQDYYIAVAEALDTTGPGCREEIRNATYTMYDWYGQPDKRLQMQYMFRLCDKIIHNNLLDYAVFFYNVAANIADVVENNLVNREFLDKTVHGNITINTLCNIMTDVSRGDSVQRYADVNTLVLETRRKECLDLRYQKVAHELNNTKWESVSDGNRQWLYQLCAEFGWALTDDSTKQPFGFMSFPWNLTFDFCGDVFDEMFRIPYSDNIDETNEYYGGLKLPLSNAVIVNGNMDPWRKISMVEEPTDQHSNVHTLNIHGTAHCADMYPPREEDPPGLMLARDKIEFYIGEWIKR